MKHFTWSDALAVVREGKLEINTAPNGVPLVAVNAPFYELMEMMEALTTGYNNLVARAAEDQKRIERLRKMAQAAFPGDHYVPADGWVSVKDFLPEKSGEYMTCTDGRVYPYSYSAKHKAFNAHDHRETPEHAIEVDYWYPRPNPPVAAAPVSEEG